MQMVIPAEPRPLLSAATAALLSVSCMLTNATFPRDVLQHVSTLSPGRTPC